MTCASSRAPGASAARSRTAPRRAQGNSASPSCGPARGGSSRPRRLSPGWDLFSAGVFEQDAETGPPGRSVCHPAAPAAVRDIGRSAGVRPCRCRPGGRLRYRPVVPRQQGRHLTRALRRGIRRRHVGPAVTSPDYPAVQAAAGAVIASRCARLTGSARREELWAAAAALDTSTLFGGFRVDPASGAQSKHRTVLVRWADGKPASVSMPTQATN